VAPPIVHDVLRAPGQPLDAGARAFMEPRFGHSFADVRVHTDARAAESARAVSAAAYTVGHDIVFSAGSYAPSGREGRRLLAHELAHVVQQRHAGGDSGGLRVDPDGQGERMADDASARIAREPGTGVQTLSPFTGGPLALQRQILISPAATPPDLDRTLDPEIERLARMFSELRYGCWCGPGNVCTQETDAIDTCCRIHDQAYERVGVSSGTLRPGQVSMWSAEGLRRTVGADLALVFCTRRTYVDPHWYGPAATLYREGVATVFTARAAIGSTIPGFH